MRQRIWFVCDVMNRYETPCVYSNEAVGKLRSDPPRCVRHGALLFSTARYDGWTREQVQKEVQQ